MLGLGNPLMGDDGLGLAALERLREEWELPPDVELVDGGTWGMNLLPLIEDAGRAAAARRHPDRRRRPAPLVELERDELPRYFSHKLSPHQIDLGRCWPWRSSAARCPARPWRIGAEPERVELRHGAHRPAGGAGGRRGGAGGRPARGAGAIALPPREPVTDA